MDLQAITDDELAILARYGDKEAHAFLWVRIQPKVEQIVDLFGRSSRWVRNGREDIIQGVLLKYPVWINRYDPAKLSTDFSKWLHHTLIRVTQDVLRQQKDQLGIGIPQKMPYPQWAHLGDFLDCESVVNDGIDRIDKQEQPNLDPDALTPFGPKRKMESDPLYHLLLYHGRNTQLG
jgi:DNA-directed RNA polymerase specialized sigma24 family protein